MRPVLGEAYRFGSSNAQQEILEHLSLDAALKADLSADVRHLLERRAAYVKVARRVSY